MPDMLFMWLTAEQIAAAANKMQTPTSALQFSNMISPADLANALVGSPSYPDLFQPYGGFPDGVRVEDGHIVMPDLPGIGFEGKSDLIKVMRDLAE